MPIKKPKGIITGGWDDVTLVCACHDTKEDMVKMVIQEGPTSLFYACPKYREENRIEGERACNNRLSLEDYTKMLEYLHGTIVEAELNDERIQLTNFTWKNPKGTQFKVLLHNGNKLVISVYNKRAISGR